MRKLFEKEAKSIKVQVNFIGKAMCAFLTFWSTATFLFFVLFFINFQSDFPLFMKINLHDNDFIDICQVIGIECYPYELKTILIKTVFNIFLIITFWMQHVIMSKLSFKLFMVRIFPEYLMIERPMFNLASQLVYFISFSLWQPIDLVLVNLLKQSLLIDIIGGIGVLIFLKSVYDLHDVADLMGFGFMKHVFKSKEITFNTKYLPADNPDSIRISRIYRMCRHPMQLGTILMILCGGKIWSISRIIYSLGLIVGINIGISYEERKLENLYDSYKQYKEEVQFRLIPNIFNLFINEKKNKPLESGDDDIKEDSTSKQSNSRKNK